MERFAKRKIKILPARDDLTGQDMVRVFFCGDNTRAFHLADYPRSYSPEMIYEKAKEAYQKLKETNTAKGKYKIMACVQGACSSMVDIRGHIMFFETREAAMIFIEQNIPESSRIDYVIVKEGEE